MAVQKLHRSLKRPTVLTLAAILLLGAGCQSMGPNAAGGGALGGLTGSLAGAAIGASEGKAPEGALIGAVTGATVGTLAGTAVDRAEERDRLEYQQIQSDLQRSAISFDSVVRMTQSGLSSDVIARQIINQGVARRPSIDELILLKNQGVDDNVIQAIQNAPIAGQFPVAGPIGRPVIIESCAAYPFPPRYPRHCYGGRRGPPRSCRGPGVGFSFGF